MPRYTHDCQLCCYLGEHGDYDLYICRHSVGSPSLIARLSSVGSDYVSYPMHIVKAEMARILVEADHHPFMAAILAVYDIVTGLADPTTPPKRAIVGAVIRTYSDKRQTKALVYWSNGTKTEGDPRGTRMQSLLDRATREGKPPTMERW